MTTTAPHAPQDARVHGARRLRDATTGRRRARPPATLLACLAAALLGPSCTTTRLSIAYEPSPAEAMSTGGRGDGAARVLASVIAVERHQRRAEADFGVSMRLRVENRGDSPLVLETGEILLLSADLTAFGPPRWSGPVEPVAPGTSGTFEAWFPFPEGRTRGDVDLDGLDLRLVVTDDAGARRVLSASFSRKPRENRDRSGYGHVHLGYGHYGHYGRFGYHGLYHWPCW